ncbi:hypothetical protein SODALDRAFT_360123 [Sodiomyces alkalinus F11]|uniref:Uncharacterized protein n=1 Tax=Sodiomyces alkalinus (strain CBS 110278 / VKM F-3762 / F11) TaxID=1314773 RepID=A0A3N2PTK3_SODAK|nr:hypothetical protein SODALDRAFT_360123 [Sodiomyces alkalinus F11]ROT37833.1 hypothetical protein SODALDRAFT_360123 [Sodiomyces alkalinus F11]
MAFGYVQAVYQLVALIQASVAPSQALGILSHDVPYYPPYLNTLSLVIDSSRTNETVYGTLCYYSTRSDLQDMEYLFVDMTTTLYAPDKPLGHRVLALPSHTSPAKVILWAGTIDSGQPSLTDPGRRELYQSSTT